MLQIDNMPISKGFLVRVNDGWELRAWVDLRTWALPIAVGKPRFRVGVTIAILCFQIAISNSF